MIDKNDDTGQYQRTRPLLITGNAMDVIDQYDWDNTIDCAITSPPYFQQVNYGEPDQIGLEPHVEIYLNALSEVFYPLLGCLKEGAVCWVIIGETVNNYSPIRSQAQRKQRRKDKSAPVKDNCSHRRPKQPNFKEKEQLSIPFRFIKMMREIGYVHRNTIIWDKDIGGVIPQATDTPPATHEYILQFGKWSKSGRMMLNCAGLKKSVIKCAPVAHSNHPAPFPSELVLELMLSSTKPGDWILDPFVGTGTTCRTAYANHRNCIGIDLNTRWAKETMQQYYLDEANMQMSLPV